MRMERLPEAVTALLRQQASINRLLVDAFEQGSRDVLLQALLLDPTTSSYRQAVELIDRFYEVQGDALPTLTWAAR
jgi:alpha-galactosidase